MILSLHRRILAEFHLFFAKKKQKTNRICKKYCKEVHIERNIWTAIVMTFSYICKY